MEVVVTLWTLKLGPKDRQFDWLNEWTNDFSTKSKLLRPLVKERKIINYTKPYNFSMNWLIHVENYLIMATGVTAYMYT